MFLYRANVRQFFVTKAVKGVEFVSLLSVPFREGVSRSGFEMSLSLHEGLGLSASDFSAASDLFEVSNLRAPELSPHHVQLGILVNPVGITKHLRL